MIEVQHISAQNNIHLTGIVSDLETKKPIDNVNVLATELKTGAISDSNGHFKLELPPNIQHKIVLSHIGCVAKTVFFSAKKDTLIYIGLQRKNVELKEVAVMYDSRKPTMRTEPGKDEIQQSEILSLPSLLGSPDIIRSVINLPGVSKGNEGDGGLYVRGGESGQNTVMLDDIEIMNPTHVLGMYSVFNPFTTQKVSVYKGVSPVYYDRKLSSVIIVQSISNDTNRIKATVNLGNILSDVGLHGSSKNKRLFYNIGFRKSYLEAYSKLGSLIPNKEKGEYLENNMVGFHDFNGKISIRSGKSSQQSLSWYLGKDYIYFDSKQAFLKTDIGWQNRGIAISSNHRFRDNQTFETVLSYSDYKFAFDGEVVDKKMSFRTDYSHVKFKSFYRHSTDNITWIGGLGMNFYHLFPKNSTITSNLTEDTNKDEFKALENILFGSFEFKSYTNWMFNVGLKLKNFMFLGPYQYYAENDSIAISYGSNQIVKMLVMPDISFSSSCEINSNSIWKTSYMFNSQNIHQGIIASIALPADLYVPSSRLIKPEYSHTFSSGITFNSIFNQNYSLSIDAYYKSMRNLLIFKVNYNSAQTVQNIEDQFYSGDGWASGIELSLLKKYGTLTGNISVSLSKSRRRFDAYNEGKWFDSKYDRIGDISTTLNYTINQKYSFNVNWIFTGGMKTTLPPGRYWMMGSVMNDFEGVNNVRLPAYHRLDIGFNIRLNSRYFDESVLNISVMNVYNRKNPFFVNYGIEAPDDNPYLLRIFAKQVSLIPILPSISWKIVF